MDKATASGAVHAGSTPAGRVFIRQNMPELPEVETIRRDLERGIVATGFLRNSMVNEEGGVDPEQFRMEAMVDRTEIDMLHQKVTVVLQYLPFADKQVGPLAVESNAF